MESALMRSLLFPLLLVSGLLVPGWLLGRAMRAPAGILGSFLGSAALLFHLLLLLDALGIPLTGGHVSGSLAVLCALLAVIARYGSVPAPTGSPPVWNGKGEWQMYHWFILPAAIGFGAIIVKAAFEPLSGFDTIFRWDFLAQQMFRECSVSFYPPITASDFQHYGWCDGIAPLISSLYFWAYLSLGKIAAWATTPLVLGQAALLFGSVYQLASHRANGAAGCAAVAILSSSCVLLWGVAMGQETGMTALTLVAMFLFIEKYRSSPQTPWLVWAGLAAGVGALAREYALAYIILGAFALAWDRIPRRGWLQFGVAALAVSLPWYLRNWLKTGNPLYGHDLGGLFPNNSIHLEYFKILNELQNSHVGNFSLSDPSVILCGIWGSIPLVFGFIGLVKYFRRIAPWLVSCGCIIALWLWSVGKTSGGAIYSLRVLTPALALAAALGGILLSGWSMKRHGRWLIACLTVVAIDASVRSLYMPLVSRTAWWNKSPLAWKNLGKAIACSYSHPNWTAIADAAEKREILVSEPGYHAILTGKGAKPVPLFSPVAAPLFENNTDFRANLSYLRLSNFRFIIISRGNPIIEKLTSSHLFFSTLLATPPVITAPWYYVYDLYSPALMHPDSIEKPAEPKPMAARQPQTR